METVVYSNFQAKVHFALFTSVKNSKEIRERIIRASTAEGAEGDAAREAVNFAFVDAKLVFSAFDSQLVDLLRFLERLQALGIC